jgi:toxin ParE1/3/4
MELVFDRRAGFDLEEIGDYIAKDNPIRAVSFVREIREHCDRLTRFPEGCPLRSEFGQDVRMSIYGRYLVFYVVDGDTLRIRRIVHGARDLPKIV